MTDSAPPHVRELEARIADLERRLGRDRPRRLGLPGGTRGRRLGLVGVVGVVLALAPSLVFAGVLFDDVPPTNTFFSDIAAIATAGVTKGCGDGNYCPKAFVTREQMAAFMNRLGALTPGKTPVANARLIDGYLAGDLARTAANSTSSMTAALTTSESTYLTVTITAPNIGYVIATATVTGRELACTTNCVIAARVRHVETGFHSQYVESWVHERESLAISHRFAVDPGSHTFQVRLHRPTAGDGNVNGLIGELTLLYVPFGSNGLPPT